MQQVRILRRAAFLALSLLSACAASDPSAGGARSDRFIPTGVAGDFLAGRFALAEGDPNTAATDLLRAVAASPHDQELILQAFIACLDAGRPEAVQLARQLPDSQVAQLVLANASAKAGNWTDAERRFRAMAHQGLTQLLQPLLIAWAQQAEGRTGAALATLQPSIDSQRFRGIFALHGAMIADLGNKPEEAGRLYKISQSELPEPSLRLAQILASWQVRSGQRGSVEHTFAVLQTAAPDISIAMRALAANAATRPVARPADGVAEAYFTLAAALRAQDAGDFAMIMIRLALDMRPNFAAARLLAADILQSQHHPELALQMLAPIPANDVLDGVVRLRRAALTAQAGRDSEAMQALKRVVADYPDSPLPDIQLGDLLRAKKRYPEAIVAYNQAIARIPHPEHADWVVFYDRGIALERDHQWHKAEADFNRALQLAPDQPFVLNYLGYSWADMGHNLSRARSMIEKAAQRRPNDGAITDSLGWVMFRQGEIDEAVKTLERAAELEPEDATINGHLGDAYWAAGRKIEAQYQWRRALTLNPGADDAAKLEAKLNPSPTRGPVVSDQ
ncbi:MAG TPA: tetratricopeptide repeat protein [Acetobacteraceae bacterium]|nr:tetratricopeptide repeat protein [Acetobacteraceae bacterium]